MNCNHHYTPPRPIISMLFILFASQLLAACNAFHVVPSSSSLSSSSSGRMRAFRRSVLPQQLQHPRQHQGQPHHSMMMNSDFATQVAERVHPQLAMILPTGVRNVTSKGTGFVVKVDDEHVYLLTAAHVAAPGLSLAVTFSTTTTTTTTPAIIIKRHTPSDLALIRVANSGDSSRTHHRPLNISMQDHIPPGTLAFANGYPAGVGATGPAMTMGIVCGMTTGVYSEGGYNTPPGNNGTNTDTILFGNTTFVVTDAAMSGGMSGGPLVDVNGVVIGVNALVRPDMRALGNYAVSAMQCRAFLEGIDDKDQDQTLHSRPYRVLLYNDRMNKRSRVSQVLKDVALLNETLADEVMMAAHTTGKGVVKEFPPTTEGRAQAEVFCNSLRMEDILVEVEQGDY